MTSAAQSAETHPRSCPLLPAPPPSTAFAKALPAAPKPRPNVFARLGAKARHEQHARALQQHQQVRGFEGSCRCIRGGALLARGWGTAGSSAAKGTVHQKHRTNGGLSGATAGEKQRCSTEGLHR